MVALPTMRGDFHFAEQSVHFSDGQDTASADGAVAGHGGEHLVDVAADPVGGVPFGEIVGEIADEAGEFRRDGAGGIEGGGGHEDGERQGAGGRAVE